MFSNDVVLFFFDFVLLVSLHFGGVSLHIMHLQPAESNGPTPVPQPVHEGPEKPLKKFKQYSAGLPFGQPTSLKSISGPTYVTAQTLIQQVAYTLSNRLWTYSPETFDLDVAVKDWFKEGAQNVYGYATNVESMQIRQGAASIALGYIFSKDFDLKKRYVPQSILASSSTLQYLRAALDQLSSCIRSPVLSLLISRPSTTQGLPPGLSPTMCPHCR